MVRRKKQELLREPKKEYRLTKEEKEVCITFNTSSDIATVWTTDKQFVKKASKVKDYVLKEETKWGYTFEIPKEEIKIGTNSIRVRKITHKSTNK